MLYVILWQNYLTLQKKRTYKVYKNYSLNLDGVIGDGETIEEAIQAIG